MLTFSLEPWDAFWKDAEPLVKQHYDEVAMDKDVIPLGFDHDRYNALDKAAALFTMAMRMDGSLIGYFVASLAAHPRYKDAGQMAFTDAYYCIPAYRVPYGVQMFSEAWKALRMRGIVKIYISHKFSLNVGPIFEALGARKTDVSYTCLLNRP